ncbi:MAG: hypothetical protein IJ317_05755 [Clostridia bacterium]|nr:hypothetical protein [Clostridia bacterium]
MKKKFVSLLLAICLAIPYMFSLVACEQTQTQTPPPELDSAKTFRYDFTIHGTQLSYIVEVPAEEYEGQGIRFADSYIELENEKRLALGPVPYEKGQEEICIGEQLYFEPIVNQMHYTKMGEYVGFGFSLEPQGFIPSFEMLEGNYTPTETTLTTIQTAGYAQNGLTLYADGTCNMVGIWGTYYPISMSEVIIIDNDTKGSAYVKLDNKTSKYETNFKEYVFGTAQLNEYYDMCLSDHGEMKRYQGNIGDDVGRLTMDDKYFLIKTLVDGRVYFGEYTIEENVITITVKDYEEDGSISTLNAVLSLDDEQQTFAIVSAD